MCYPCRIVKLARETNKKMTMKNIFTLIISIIVISLTYSCSKTELMDYEGSEGIYFYVQRVPISGYGDTTLWSANATTLFEFTKLPVVDTLHTLRVRVTGHVKDYDRAFEVRINKDSTTAVDGVNYEFDSSNTVIKAGMHYADVPIKIIRSENLETDQLRVTVQLLPNENFKLAFNKLYSLPGTMPMDKKDEGHDPAFHSIYMNYFLVRPATWMPLMDFEEGEIERGSLGQFGIKKFNLMSEVCKVTYDMFLSTATMPTTRITVLGQQMAAYLTNQFNNGTPVLEDDGRLMWVMGVPWNSTIGVAYIPVKK